ncbi:kinase-like protein [Heliocybe sulcata]|uniref:Kinase-like protein n=1 Tax=Heliocybe sulcata TaxID=5364 RepID=A0A5C3N710_9AGAM|nr:kinase-like protein [Heliocybe sulcata]
MTPTAEVYKSEWLNESVAMKVVTHSVHQGQDEDPERRKKAFLRELVLWRQLRHRHILPLLAMHSWPMGTSRHLRFCMVSPWAANGTLRAYLESYKPQPNDRVRIIVSIADALSYLHAHEPQLVHGDLHIGNVVVDSNHQPLITDFGLSQFYGSFTTSQISGDKCAMVWRAPELWESQTFEPRSSSDMYAFAFLCYEVLSGRRPWSNKTVFKVHSMVISGERPPRSRSISDDLWQIIRACWRPDHAERMPAIEAWDRLRALQAVAY